MIAERLVAAGTARPMPREGVTTVTLVILCQVFHSLTFVGVALFLPLIREDLGITFAQAGLLLAAGTRTYGLGQPPAGYLSDRYGPRRLFFIGLAMWSLLCVGLGMVRSFEGALAIMLLAGAFRSLLFAPGLSLLALWFPPERRATAMSLYMVGGFTGTILLSLIGPVLATRFGWRAAFIGFALVGVAAALVYIVYAREKPRRSGGPSPGLAEVLRLMRHRIIWVCSAIQFIRFSVVTGLTFWLPSFLVADRGLSLETAGLVAAMSAALTAASNAIGGYVSDRLHNPPLVIGGSLAVLACVSTLIVTVESLPLLLVVVAVGSIFLQFYFGPLFFVPIEVLGVRTAGMATGLTNLFANGGGLITAYALGLIKDSDGSFTWGFIGIGALCLIGVALSVALARMRRRALAAELAYATP
ncbi:MAG TPA: MFS transporter [Burkholderiales bacterium]|nr:MFS transporter [Burkholderiales bacterium]